MNYCITNSQRTTGCCYEFQNCRFSGHWLDSSAYIDFDIFEQLNLYTAFAGVFPDFNPCGPNELTHEQWEKVKAACGGEALLAIEEIEAQLGELGETITILGV